MKSFLVIPYFLLSILTANFMLQCKPASLCNSSDPSSECGLLQLLLQKPNKNVTSVSTVSVSNSTPTTTTVSGSPHCTSCKIFLTATTYNANLSGITGADTKCSTDANKPGTGTYKALVVDDVNRKACSSTNCTTSGNSEHIDWVLYANTTYVQAANTSNIIFTTDSNAVFNGTLTNTISAAAGVWTGIKNNPNWDWQTDTTHTCSAWTDSVSANCGTYGVTSWTDSRSIAITSAYGSGGTLNNLLCVEQ